MTWYRFIGVEPFSSVKYALLIPLVYVLVLIPSAFAQTGDQVEGMIEEGVDTLIDEITDNIDLDQENFLNATEEETEALKHSGKDMLSEVFDLFFASSGFTGLSPGSVCKDAILSKVSKLSWVIILPNTVYCESRKFEF